MFSRNNTRNMKVNEFEASTVRVSDITNAAN